jgi:lysozyme family protein
VVASFESSLRILLGLEGGYSNHPSDIGGETWMGVSRKFWPKWPGWLRVDAAKADGKAGNALEKALRDDLELQAQVASFYRESFWGPIRGDDLPSQGLADEMFEMAVHLGPQKPVAWLQAALNALNRQGSLYDEIHADGLMGPHTLDSLHSYLTTDPVGMLVKLLNVEQGHYYFEGATRDRDKETFLRGWLGRVVIGGAVAPGG